MSQPGTTDDDGDMGTPYHESVREFRRDLIAANLDHWKAMKSHQEAVFAVMSARSAGDKAAAVDQATSDAYTGQMMAAGYAYALAVALELAEQLDPVFAMRIASRADCVLTNGGEPEYCADVWPPEDDHIRTGDSRPTVTISLPAQGSST